MPKISSVRAPLVLSARARVVEELARRSRHMSLNAAIHSLLADPDWNLILMRARSTTRPGLPTPLTVRNWYIARYPKQEPEIEVLPSPDSYWETVKP